MNVEEITAMNVGENNNILSFQCKSISLWYQWMTYATPVLYVQSTLLGKGVNLSHYLAKENNLANTSIRILLTLMFLCF